MFALLLVGIVVAGLVIYFAVVRPFLVPLEWRIPSGRAYQPTLAACRARP